MSGLDFVGFEVRDAFLHMVDEFLDESGDVFFEVSSDRESTCVDIFE